MSVLSASACPMDSSASPGHLCVDFSSAAGCLGHTAGDVYNGVPAVQLQQRAYPGAYQCGVVTDLELPGDSGEPPGIRADAPVGAHGRLGGSVWVGRRCYRCWGEHLRRHALQYAHGELAARLLWYRGDQWAGDHDQRAHCRSALTVGLWHRWYGAVGLSAVFWPDTHVVARRDRGPRHVSPYSRPYGAQ